MEIPIILNTDRYCVLIIDAFKIFLYSVSQNIVITMISRDEIKNFEFIEAQIDCNQNVVNQVKNKVIDLLDDDTPVDSSIVLTLSNGQIIKMQTHFMKLLKKLIQNFIKSPESIPNKLLLPLLFSAQYKNDTVKLLIADNNLIIRKDYKILLHIELNKIFYLDWHVNEVCAYCCKQAHNFYQDKIELEFVNTVINDGFVTFLKYQQCCQRGDIKQKLYYYEHKQQLIERTYILKSKILNELREIYNYSQIGGKPVIELSFYEDAEDKHQICKQQTSETHESRATQSKAMNQHQDAQQRVSNSTIKGNQQVTLQDTPKQNGKKVTFQQNDVYDEIIVNGVIGVQKNKSKLSISNGTPTSNKKSQVNLRLLINAKQNISIAQSEIQQLKSRLIFDIQTKKTEIDQTILQIQHSREQKVLKSVSHKHKKENSASDQCQKNYYQNLDNLGQFENKIQIHLDTNSLSNAKQQQAQLKIQKQKQVLELSEQRRLK